MLIIKILIIIIILGWILFQGTVTIKDIINGYNEYVYPKWSFSKTYIKIAYSFKVRGIWYAIKQNVWNFIILILLIDIIIQCLF